MVEPRFAFFFATVNSIGFSAEDLMKRNGFSCRLVQAGVASFALLSSLLAVDRLSGCILAPEAPLANGLDELLFSMIVLGEDRLVERTVIS